MNSSHYNKAPGYFEWWYFHFASESGFTANMVLHETDIFGLTKKPYASMSFQLPNCKPQYLKTTVADKSIARNSKYLSQSDGLVQENKNKIKINLNFPEGKSFKATVTKLAKPLLINNGVLYQEGNKSSTWRLQVPLGHFDGVLKIDGKHYPVKGSFYHDHQWGNIPIQNFVSDWAWGHFSSNKYSAVFFAILTQKGELIERYGVFSSDSIESSASPGQITHLKKLVKSSNPESWSGKPTITFPFKTTLKTEINPSKLMRSRVNEKHNGFTATYLRWAGKAKLSSSDSPHLGISEYIRIRRQG